MQRTPHPARPRKRAGTVRAHKQKEQTNHAPLHLMACRWHRRGIPRRRHSIVPAVVIAWLAFAISIGTLVISAGIGYGYRRHIATLVTALATVLVSGWTLVASLVFSEATVGNLALASALAISGLAIAGVTEHELSRERLVAHSAEGASERESKMAAAA
jgi:hypothetical protein